MAKIGSARIPGSTRERPFHMSPGDTQVWLGSNRIGGGRTLVGDTTKSDPRRRGTVGGTAQRIADAAAEKGGRNRW